MPKWEPVYLMADGDAAITAGLIRYFKITSIKKIFSSKIMLAKYNSDQLFFSFNEKCSRKIEKQTSRQLSRRNIERY
jgi:hypothetical protein